ncbi:MAG: tetratricopeptide repeat protein [Acidobacteriota bacterium]
MNPSRVVVVVVLLALTHTSSAATGLRQAFSPPQAGESSAAEVHFLAAEALRLLNQSRAEAGLAALISNPTLELLAADHSQEMAESGVVSHYSARYALSTERRVRISFPDVPRLGENVARNRSLSRLHAALMGSPGHRKNRLDPHFTHVGIGLARANRYLLYLTEVFVQVPAGDRLGKPVALYFDAFPGAYELRESPRVHIGGELLSIPPPGDGDPEYWTNRGIFAYEGGDLQAAERDFRHALGLDPGYEYARFNLARVFLQAGRPQEAADFLDDVLDHHPEDTDARFSRGSAALLLGDYGHAEKGFRQVLAARPKDPAAWYNLGLSLEYQERLPAAEAAYRQALHYDPDFNEAQIGLGRIQR